MSVTFGGVNSAKAYLVATCNFGRDATIKSERNTSYYILCVTFNAILVDLKCIVSGKKDFISHICKVITILHYVMTFVIATLCAHLLYLFTQ